MDRHTVEEHGISPRDPQNVRDLLKLLRINLQIGADQVVIAVR
jgi:hypothetical protein